MERVGGFVELFTQKVPAVCAIQKNNPSTASGPLSFARKVKCFPYGTAPPNLPHKGGRKRRHKQIARLRNKCAMTCIGDMKQNSFTDMVYSPFTTHLFIPIRTFHVSLLTFH